MNDRINLVTNAPEAYDGFGTKTKFVCRNDDGSTTVDRSGNPFRFISVVREYQEWQTGRNRSGLYVSLTPEEFLVLEDVLTRKP